MMLKVEFARITGAFFEKKADIQAKHPVIGTGWSAHENETITLWTRIPVELTVKELKRTAPTRPLHKQLIRS
jgi:hypothetical protein